MVTKTLKRANNPLALPIVQLETLSRADLIPSGEFGRQLAKHAIEPLKSDGIEILQVNVGKVCNQTCSHCHVDAGPDRRENMTRETAERVMDLLQQPQIHTLDITGGAPEMNPQFRWLVQQARQLGKHVIDRCNLTILQAPGYEELHHFLAEHQVEIVASLPCYLEQNCDAQRGDGVFRKSIAALQKLCLLGYGLADSGLTLSLVYNPVGYGLPPDQGALEADYRRQLLEGYGIVFSRLYAITNMPISRFLDDLLQAGKYTEYMHKLIAAFNPLATRELMCRKMLSVDWQGFLYDCDFNQMLELPLQVGGRNLHNFDWSNANHRTIATANHCLGCTAGAGSSCQGAIV